MPNGKQISPFDRIRQVGEHGEEYWSARDLAKALGYTRWETFPRVIAKAEKACEVSGYTSPDQFRRTTKLIQSGKGAQRQIDDWHLSRYACYLVAQNADPSKEIVARAQTYFAAQTRRAELADEGMLAAVEEDQQRLFIRQQMAAHNKRLSAAAQQAGVKTGLDFAQFHNAGYRGLYGGMGKADIATRRGLPSKTSILDHMGSIELAANLFRATQTEEKLRREQIRGKERANDAHHDVGREVRNVIRRIGGTMPEELPTPTDSVNDLKRQVRRKIVASLSTETLPAPTTATPKRRSKRTR